MDFLKDIVKRLVMNTHNSLPILTRLNNMWIRVRTFLTDSFQVVYLVVYLGINYCHYGESSTGKLSSVSLLLKISLTATLMVIVSILTLKQQLINLFFRVVESTSLGLS